MFSSFSTSSSRGSWFDCRQERKRSRLGKRPSALPFLLNVTLDSLRREEQFAFGSLMPRKWELAFVTIEIIAGHTQAPGAFINAEMFIAICEACMGAAIRANATAWMAASSPI